MNRDLSTKFVLCVLCRYVFIHKIIKTRLSIVDAQSGPTLFKETLEMLPNDISDKCASIPKLLVSHQTSWTEYV